MIAPAAASPSQRSSRILTQKGGKQWLFGGGGCGNNIIFVRRKSATSAVGCDVNDVFHINDDERGEEAAPSTTSAGCRRRRRTLITLLHDRKYTHTMLVLTMQNKCQILCTDDLCTAWTP